LAPGTNLLIFKIVSTIFIEYQFLYKVNNNVSIAYFSQISLT
jgi:hypothetical protein